MNYKRHIAQLIDPRIKNALKNLYDEYRIRRNHARGVRYVRKHCVAIRPLRVQFGCGPVRKSGWLNTDLWPGPWSKPDICLDVSREFPFKSNSVAEIYTEHMFEHLDYPSAASTFLKESYRVLEAGGILTIGVPDLDFIYARYHSMMQDNPPLRVEKRNYVIGHPLEELNDCFHQSGEHKFLYNEQFLTELLLHFGFVNPQRRQFDPAIDSEQRKEGTLYIVSKKP